MKNNSLLWDIPTKLDVKNFQWVKKNGKSPGNHILGKGSYGEVKLCRNQNNKLFACKIIEKKRVTKLKMEAYIKQEVELHLQMKHPHILKLYGCAQDEENIYLFLDYCKNNCVYFYLKKKKNLKENAAFTFFFQTALGKFCYSVCFDGIINPGLYWVC
jgi:serine/threonine protein kinase